MVYKDIFKYLSRTFHLISVYLFALQHRVGILYCSHIKFLVSSFLAGTLYV